MCQHHSAALSQIAASYLYAATQEAASASDYKTEFLRNLPGSDAKLAGWPKKRGWHFLGFKFGS